jgi:Zn-dependent protease with chaperone function
MDFFARQEQSRRKTRALVVLFTLAVLATVTAVTIAAGVLIALYRQPYRANGVSSLEPAQWIVANADILLLVAGVTAAFIGLASLYRIVSLGSRGGRVARLLGGTEISPSTTDPLERRLVNVVEEMAIASGIAVPEIYVLDQEGGINAFAAGLSPQDAAVAVTRGALDRLTRAELQGVIAHEFSHILNGDMRLNQKLLGFSFGILALSLTGRWLLRSVRFQQRSRSNGAGFVVVAIGVALAIIGAIGLFFSRLIKAGVSRQRELLADASAVQFTRDRDGLAGALKKIGGYGGTVTARNSEEVAHMLFTRGARAFRGWFATHPPLDERIRALDPSFVAGDYATRDDVLPHGVPADESLVRLSATSAEPPTSDAAIVDRVGNIAPHETAAALLVAMPEAVDHAAHSRELSLLLVLALGLSRDVRIQHTQMELLTQQLGAQRAEKCKSFVADIHRLGDRYRLPILELTIPALRQRPVEQLEFVIGLLERLVAMTDGARLFDFVLVRVLKSYLGTTHDTPPAYAAIKPMRSARDAVRVLLRCVAAYGHDEPRTALEAYRAGIGRLFAKPTRESEPSFEPIEAARRLDTLDAALARLDRLRPRLKQRLLMGILSCVHSDRQITVDEIELTRGIAASLGCPMPPLEA